MAAYFALSSNLAVSVIDESLAVSPVTDYPAVDCRTSKTNIFGTVSGALVNNCELYYSVETGTNVVDGCLKCKLGFRGVITNVIDRCVTYKTTHECKTCETGYYTPNKLKCVAIVAISNCSTYNNGIIGTTTCLTCNTSHYLNGAVCASRSKTKDITSCSALAIGDDCTTCASNHFKVVNGTGENSIRCVVLPTNCITLDTASVCTECNHTVSYLTGSTCITGSVVNCIQYANGANTCTKCEGERYIEGNLCKDHNSILNCQDYSQSQAHTCQNCNSQNFNFKINNKCM